jgi:hypothetical protein
MRALSSIFALHFLYDILQCRPMDYWKVIFQTLQAAVPSATSVSQAIQALTPTPTPASKFLLSSATSRSDAPLNCGEIAHAACSVLLRAMRIIPAAATAIMNILCAAQCYKLFFVPHRVETLFFADKAALPNKRLLPLIDALSMSESALRPYTKKTLMSLLWLPLCMP